MIQITKNRQALYFCFSKIYYYVYYTLQCISTAYLRGRASGADEGTGAIPLRPPLLRTCLIKQLNMQADGHGIIFTRTYAML